MDNQLTVLDKEFFLEFSSKEEYLFKRNEWRKAYKCLSEEIRHNKKVSRNTCSIRSKVANSLGLNSIPWYEWDDHQKRSYHDIVEQETKHISHEEYAYTKYYDATEMLEIRHMQKAMSKEQREKQFLSCNNP